MKTYPRVYVKNSEGINLQIIQTDKEFEIFKKKDAFRRCLIKDVLNYNIWKKGEAPYNQENIYFGIKVELYEACSGHEIKKFG